MARGIYDDNGGVVGGRGRDDASEGLETTMEAERIQGRRQRLRRRDDGPGELPTTTEESAEEDKPKVSMMTTEALEREEKTRLSECLRRRMQRCVYGIRVLTTTSALSE